MSRFQRLAVLALMLLAAEATSARADVPSGRWPWSKTLGPRRPSYDPTDESRPDEPEAPPRPEPPKRNGPFRSCGSGAGTGFAAIGITWGVLWLGNRFAGRVRETKGQPPR